MPVSVLLVENCLGDVRLTQEAFRDVNDSIHLQVASDGVEAMALLKHAGADGHAPRPACILLDLNLPRMDGREVLAHIKKDVHLKAIPTVVLTTSEAEADILKSYELQANCYLSKPGAWDAFESLVRSIDQFWLTKAPGLCRINGPAQAPHHAGTFDLSRPDARQQGSAGNNPFAPIGVGRERAKLMRAIGENGMTIEVLLVEDSPGDVRLTQEAFRDANRSIRLHVAADGVEAMAFLKHEGVHIHAPRPDLILLDLNLPRMDGREVLTHIKEDHRLKTIPTVILTTSEAEADIVKSYELQANCYLTKPVQLDAFESLVRSINDFWLNKVKLPQQTLS
jgi:chemotaxis family two-component system response regulator Rcp1